jgi:DNA invertase Pin-like site-specific DNA recombinase
MSSQKRACAVYTRKSTEDRLDMEFNSLDAQREACLAYITSQRSEGWVAVDVPYDDGGFSGGTMARPALGRLLADIAQGRVQIIVVYKIDRLTRSLMDFARLVQLFDQHGVTFVSVTQSFNTTTSMGRLTLNVLLSFAQFEREVTGERIRDKIAASKRKGMWMGGLVPLGYEARDRHLFVNEAEADTVRHIFTRYLVLDSVRCLKVELDRSGITSKARVYQDGRVVPGKPLAGGALYTILSNPVYIGRIRHGQDSYPGQHAAIISPDLWEAVQTRLAQKAANPRSSKLIGDPNPFTGKLVAGDGSAYSASFTVKAGRRYRYYVNQTIVPAHRLPAHALESAIETGLRRHLGDFDRLAALLASSILPAAVIEPQWLAEITRHQAGITGHTLLQTVDRIVVQANTLTVEMALTRLLAQLPPILPADAAKWSSLAASANGETVPTLILTLPYATERRAHGAVVVAPRADYPDPLDLPPEQLRKLVQGVVWRDLHFSGQTILTIAGTFNVSPAQVGRQIFATFAKDPW